MRASRALPALLLALSSLSACSGDEPGSRASPAAVPDLAQDDRISWLLASRTRSEPFLGDTGDLVPALVSKLASGQAEPLGAAKLELAAAGTRALPELTRFLERHFPDALAAPRVMNALEVAAAMTIPEARPLLLRGLDHNSGSVRLAALRGLKRHALPEDFERLRATASLTGSEGHVELALALWQSDAPRVVRELVTWVDGAMPAPVLLALGPRLSQLGDPEALQRFRELLPRLQGELRGRLLAALAHGGDPAARAELQNWLVEGDVGRRELAAHCLHDAGLQRELLPRLREDGYKPVRLIAAQALSELPPDDEIRAALQNALGDPAMEVRGLALGVLLKQHDPLAENEALELLKGEKSELERALVVLREGWVQDRGLAERALAILEGLASGATGPLRVEPSSLWRAISQVPLERAARVLYEQIERQAAPEAGPGAHRWFLTQIGNTGEEGWRFVRERWRSEGDPARRVDLVMASTYDRGEASRAFLEEVVESPRITPLELLHAAGLLARLGPAERVAPRLKRIALTVSDRAVRPALNNLLWNWYGLER